MCLSFMYIGMSTNLARFETLQVVVGENKLLALCCGFSSSSVLLFDYDSLKENLFPK